MNKDTERVKSRLESWEYELKTNKHGFQRQAERNIKLIKAELKILMNKEDKP